MRLAFKILLLIVAVLVAGFGASTVLSIQREKDLLVEQSKISARRVTATLVASVEAAMLQERPDVTRMVLAELPGRVPATGRHGRRSRKSSATRASDCTAARSPTTRARSGR